MIANPNRRTTTYIVDDCPLLCEGLTAMLQREHDFEVIGCSSDSDEGFRRIIELKPDLVLCDVELPGRGAFTMAEEVLSRLPALNLVFFTDYVTDVFLDQTLRVNARGYLLKDERPAQIVQALRAVDEGRPAARTAAGGATAQQDGERQRDEKT